MDSRDTMIEKRDRYRAAAEQTVYPEMARSYTELAAELDKQIAVVDGAVRVELAKHQGAAKSARPAPTTLHKAHGATRRQARPTRAAPTPLAKAAKLDADARRYRRLAHDVDNVEMSAAYDGLAAKAEQQAAEERKRK